MSNLIYLTMPSYYSLPNYDGGGNRSPIAGHRGNLLSAKVLDLFSQKSDGSGDNVLKYQVLYGDNQDKKISIGDYVQWKSKKGKTKEGKVFQIMTNGAGESIKIKILDERMKTLIIPLDRIIKVSETPFKKEVSGNLVNDFLGKDNS